MAVYVSFSSVVVYNLQVVKIKILGPVMAVKPRGEIEFEIVCFFVIDKIGAEVDVDLFPLGGLHTGSSGRFQPDKGLLGDGIVK